MVSQSDLVGYTIMLQFPRGHWFIDTLHKEGKTQIVTTTEAVLIVLYPSTLLKSPLLFCCLYTIPNLHTPLNFTPVLDFPYIFHTSTGPNQEYVGETPKACNCHQGQQLSYSCVKPSAEVVVLCFIRFKISTVM